MRAEDAIGRWPGLYASLGISVGDGRHTACPLCGKVKFRMDDKAGKGSWVCTCGAGDGFKLVQLVLGCDFKGALKQIEPLIGTVTPSAVCREEYASPEVLRKMFVESVKASDNNLVGAYLKSRGLNTIPDCLRYSKGCWENETKKNQPAMLAVVTLPDGTASTMHRTYLDRNGGKLKGVDQPKKMMPGVKKSTGGAIRLMEPTANGVIGVAEGIETAIACHELHGIPTWAAVSAGMMAAFEPPPGIKKVWIFGDNDSHKSYAGQAAAYALAKRLVEIKKMPVEVLIPDGSGDWLDDLIFRKNK